MNIDITRIIDLQNRSGVQLDVANIVTLGKEGIAILCRNKISDNQKDAIKLYPYCFGVRRNDVKVAGSDGYPTVVYLHM